MLFSRTHVSFVLGPHHIHSNLLQCTLSRVFRFKTLLTLPAEHTAALLWRNSCHLKRKTKKRSGGRNSGCWVLYVSHGSVSRDSISQGGRRFFGVFLNQANKGFPLHDHQTFFSEINRNEWKSYIPSSIQNKKHCEILKVYKVKSFWNSPSRSQKV